jgi:ligand-binding sensor domain-containing protein
MIHRNILRILIGCTLLLGVVQTVDAQLFQATRSHLSAEDGLVSNAVSGIYQDDLGYLWIATWNGLSRYDGYHFYNYRTGNASRIDNLHNRILDLVIDQSQNVWMRMYDGRVFVLDRTKDQFINPFEGISGNEDFKTDIPLMVTSWGEVLVSIGLGQLYLMRLDKNGLKSRTISTGGAIILSMAEGTKDDILLGTDKGVRHLNQRSLTIDKKVLLEEEEINCMYVNGFSIYAGTNKGAIYQLANRQKPNLIRSPSGLGIQFLFVDSQGLVWFCDDRMGAYRLNPENGNEKFFQQTVLAPEYDGRNGSFRECYGTVWVRMNHGGYGYYNREADVVEYFHNDPSNPWNLSNTVQAVLELPEGVVWESTNQRGLEKLEILKKNILRVRPVPHATSTMENEIRAFYYDKERRLLLFGNKSGQLFIYHDNKSQTIITRDAKGEPLGRIYGISKGRNGDYWICSKDDGLYKMSPNGSSWTLEHFAHDANNKQSINSNSAYYAIEDQDGNLWIATYGGGVNLMTKVQGKTVFLSPGNGLEGYPKGSHMRVRTVEMDEEGNIWAATTDGILIMSYKNKQLKIEKLQIPKKSDKMLMSNDIVCLRRDNKGTMWVGTHGGGLGYTVGKDEDGTWLFESFNAQDGLPSDEIRSITFDQMDNAWFSMEHAICSFDVSKRVFTVFSSLDGVDDTMLSEGGAITLDNGTMLFGTLDGYYVVDRKKLTASMGSLLKLQITDFFIDGQLMSPRLNDTYDYYVPLSKHVELPSGVDEFAFRFAAMNYQLQHRVHYQYILEGYEDEWHNAEKDLTARYSDLPAGTYTFRVRAFLLESPEKYDQRSIEVVVPQFFLFSTTARWIYLGILVVIGLALLVKYRKKWLRALKKDKTA